MFQLEYLNRQKMPSQIRFQTLFRDFLNELPGDLPYAVETRNPNYINRWHTYIEEFETVVIRLHGPDRLHSLSAGSKIFSPYRNRSMKKSDHPSTTSRLSTK